MEENTRKDPMTASEPNETQSEEPREPRPQAEGPTAESAPEAAARSEESGRDEAIEQFGSGPNAADIERLEAEKADLTDRLLRTAADMDNLRRRSERDLADARKYAVQKFAADMLVVADNLRRALDAFPPDKRQSADETLKGVIEGVEMTAREMERLLERHGVRRIEAEGERFDPHRHQAMFEVPNPDVPAGTVVQVVQDGYVIGDRVLRAAMVGVSTGGPAQAAAAQTSEGAQNESAAQA